MADLAALAGRLRDLHQGDMLVLPNVWDGQSARIVEEAGFPAVATSSGAIARMLGRSDGEDMTADEAFAAVAVIARSVTIPVTADLESGYGLDPDEFVGRLLEAGAVGCNYEDTDHAAGGTGLVDAALQAELLAAVKDAGRRAGVDLVLNARVDTFVRGVERPLEAALERGRRYLERGHLLGRKSWQRPETRVNASRLLPVDPVEGGSCSDYDYVCGDAINKVRPRRRALFSCAVRAVGRAVKSTGRRSSSTPRSAPSPSALPVPRTDSVWPALA